jgi:glucokinase
MLTLGTGVGGGVFANGRILRGASGAAGHIGHLTIDPDGPLCVCGNRGCLETLFSARAIESEAFAALHRGVETRLAACQSKVPTCAEVFELAQQGDAVAGDIVQRATKVLGAALAGLAHVLDPEVIIPRRADFRGKRCAAARTVAAGRRMACALPLRRDVPVVRSKLVDPSGVIGAAAQHSKRCGKEICSRELRHGLFSAKNPRSTSLRTCLRVFSTRAPLPRIVFSNAG